MRRSFAPSQRSKRPGFTVPRRAGNSLAPPPLPRAPTSLTSSPSPAPAQTRQPGPARAEQPTNTAPTKKPLAPVGNRRPAAPPKTAPALAGTLPRKKAKFVSPAVMKSTAESATSTSDTDGDEWKYFSVVWCKMSKKKHKKWEGDAFLKVRNSTAVLKNHEGKDISKSSTMRASDLKTLKEGETLYIGGKEVEIMGTVQRDDWESGKCFLGGATSVEPTAKHLMKSASIKSFKRLRGKGDNVVQKKAAPLKPKFDPSLPGALVLDHPHGKRHEGVQVVVDPHLSQHLRPHQREGVSFLWQSIVGRPDVDGFGCILGDEMGLGKTLQCITALWTALKQGYHGKPLCSKAIVICPGSLVGNWDKEFRKWLGPERIKVFVARGEKKVNGFMMSSVYQVLLLSYELFLRNVQTLQKASFDLVICDEAHRLKNSSAKISRAMMSLLARKRIALTGTPIQNDLKEFYAIVDFCNPGVFQSPATFRRIYEAPILRSRQPECTQEERLLGEKRGKELSRMIAAFCLRRTNEINLAYLPPKSDFVLFVRPSLLQKRLYRALLSSSAVRTCMHGRSCTQGEHLMIITALKMLCNSPTMLCASNYCSKSGEEAEDSGDVVGELLRGAIEQQQKGAARALKKRRAADNSSEDHDAEPQLTLSALASLDDVEDEALCGKLQALSQMLAYWRAHPAKERVLIVSNYTKCLTRVQQLCEKYNYPFLRLQGDTPTEKRMQLVDRFNSRNHDDYVFLMSSKAGGVGLNIIGASRLILYDTDWNPANDLQAMARVWRDGQKRHVYVYRLLTTGTIEEKIYQRQVHKQGISDSVVEEGAKSTKGASSARNKGFSMADLKDIFMLREDTASDTFDLLETFGTTTKKKSASVSLDTLLTWTRSASDPVQLELFDDETLSTIDSGLLSCVFSTVSVPDQSNADEKAESSQKAFSTEQDNLASDLDDEPLGLDESESDGQSDDE